MPTGKALRDMTDLLYTMAAYVLGQVALFALALFAYVRWQVPARDLIVLLRECRLLPPRRDCSGLFVQVQRKRVHDESTAGITRSPLCATTLLYETRVVSVSSEGSPTDAPSDSYTGRP